MKVLMVMNDGPYGNERPFNALRLADVLLRLEEDLELTLFLLGDGVSCALAGQKVPQGYYNIATMLKGLARKALVMACTTCMDARGITDEMLVSGCRRARLGDLGMAVLEADKVLTF